MKTERVVQRNTFTCDKCGSFEIEENELESCYDGYQPIFVSLPADFIEIEDKILCTNCKEELDKWFENR